jgi:carboxypeptidase family protein
LRHIPLNIFSILLLIAFSQSISWGAAQTPQRDNRPRTASISGRVTISGKPAANAAVTITDNALKIYADDSESPIRFETKARTDGDGRYLVGGLAEGRYLVRVALNAFVDSGKAFDPDSGRMVTLDEGEARENIDFPLIRGGVITGKVMDAEGAPLIAKRVQLYTLDEQGQKIAYEVSSSYEMNETDDRGVYRVYGLPPGRYIISVSSEDAKFVTTWHPDTTDEKQARIIDIKEGTEVTDVDIRFGSARKTYVASGRVVDRETGKPVPRVYILTRAIQANDEAIWRYGMAFVADGQGNFKALGLLPGRYLATVRDVYRDAGYMSEAAEFEVTNDNVSGVEVKAFLGASISGFVVIEGAAAGDRLQSLLVFAHVKSLSDANNPSSVPSPAGPASVGADGSFTIKGLNAGKVSFMLISDGPRIKRIEHDGVEVKDAIEVKAGENIAGVRIVAFNPQGRIRGQFQIAGGALPDNWQLEVNARRLASADESNSGGRIPVSPYAANGHALVDEKGRFVIERLPSGEYDLSFTLTKLIAKGQRESIGLRELNQRVTVVENGSTPVTINLDLSRINFSQNQPNNMPNNMEERQ